MAVIQAACDQIGPDQYCEYYDSWYGKDWLTAHYDCAAEQLGRSREQLEQSYPAFYYLGQATEHAMDDIRRTRVEAGIAVWHVYNMGYVFKTADACFGIDVLGPGVERLADDLDFLLVSHRHGDHWHGVLEERMIRLGKPVLSRTEGMPGSTVVASGGERRFGSVRVRIDLGDHVCAGSRHEIARCRDSVLMFHVDCEDELGQYTVYHAGDGGNVAKMCPDKRVDVLIIHNSVPGQKAVRQLRPRMIFASHVMELGHSPKLPNFGRVPFEFAYRWSLRGLDEDQSAVLTWGERWLYPGTVIKAALETPQ